MTQKEMAIYDSLVELEIATADELNLARCLMSGTWLEVLEAVIFARTGYRTYDQMLQELMEEDWTNIETWEM